MNVLVVEDEGLVGLQLRRRLELGGHRVLDVVPTGEEALQVVASCAPDLILLDVELGGCLDGIATALAIRERRSIPLVFLSARSRTWISERLPADFQFLHLAKPFDLEALYQCMASCGTEV